MGTDISDFGVGGSGLQDTRDILQGSDPSSATVNIGDMGNEPTHKNNDGEISPPGGLFYHRKTTEGIGGEWGGTEGSWRYPPLAETIMEAGLEKVDNYVTHHKKMVAQ